MVDDRPRTRLNRRYHGDPSSVVDSERRGLRPIGATVQQAAARTDELLHEIAARQTIHIFQGVLPVGVSAPRIPHVISVGRQVIFIESVIWPSGRYILMGGHRVYCDDVYTGQSVQDLVDNVHRWRRMLPTDHHVSALVVVHPLDNGLVVLPSGQARDLRWTHPLRMARDLCDLLPSLPQVVSQAALVALANASEVSPTLLPAR